MLAAAAVFALLSVPSVFLSRAAKRYFNFVGHWNVATVKSSRSGIIPPFRGRQWGPREIPQPELRFVKFSVKMAGAKEVRIAADFNKWNPGSLALVKNGKNLWEALIPLPPGKYRYICLVDGKETLDPLNPDTDIEGGRKVSLLTVK